LREIRHQLSAEFSLTQEELEQRVPSGEIRLFEREVGMARTYLKKAGLIEYVERGAFRITDQGRRVLSSNPSNLDLRGLHLLDQR
jgi:restriction system protein